MTGGELRLPLQKVNLTTKSIVYPLFYTSPSVWRSQQVLVRCFSAGIPSSFEIRNTFLVLIEVLLPPNPNVLVNDFH